MRFSKASIKAIQFLWKRNRNYGWWNQILTNINKNSIEKISKKSNDNRLRDGWIYWRRRFGVKSFLNHENKNKIKEYFLWTHLNFLSLFSDCLAPYQLQHRCICDANVDQVWWSVQVGCPLLVQLSQHHHPYHCRNHFPCDSRTVLELNCEAENYRHQINLIDWRAN